MLSHRKGLQDAATPEIDQKLEGGPTSGADSLAVGPCAANALLTPAKPPVQRASGREVLAPTTMNPAQYTGSAMMLSLSIIRSMARRMA